MFCPFYCSYLIWRSIPNLTTGYVKENHRRHQTLSRSIWIYKIQWNENDTVHKKCAVNLSILLTCNVQQTIFRRIFGCQSISSTSRFASIFDNTNTISSLHKTSTAFMNTRINGNKNTTQCMMTFKFRLKIFTLIRLRHVSSLRNIVKNCEIYF